MLNRKLHKIGLLCLGLFLMSANARRNIVVSVSDSSSKHNQSSLIHHHSLHTFDSAGLCICLYETNADNLSGAPRMQLNSGIKKFVKDYIQKNSFDLDKIKTRGAGDLEMMDEIFCDYDMPAQLKYLAVIESELKVKIVSQAGAAGIWQLMPATARTLGLKVGRRYDERKLRCKSTEAAAKYLNTLYNQFGDWMLAIAAYNCGPGGVNKAIRKSGSRNFWHLQNFLPKETRNYVKKYISVHYYFEGHGSVTTLTRDEMNKHTKAVAAFIRKSKSKEEHIETKAIASTNK